MSNETLFQKITSKWKPTAIVVAIFVAILIAAGYSDEANSHELFNDISTTVGVGHTVVNSNLKVGWIGVESNQVEVNARLIEAGDTKNGWQEQMEIVSLSYLTKPDWGYKGINPYFRLGVSKNFGSELVGEENFMLGVGLNFHNVWRFEYVHDSSAGIQPVNSGIDQLVLTREF